MGIEISESDIAHPLHALCDHVISISEYRAQISEYLRNLMIATAPRLTTLVGELVGARLISHAGSLLNLAKHRVSTDPWRRKGALSRTEDETRHINIWAIYHASFIGQAPSKLKGRVRAISYRLSIYHS
jgi:nucleolar protein 58